MNAKNFLPRGSSAGLKFLLIIFLVLIFLIPLTFIQRLISNRSYLQDQVQQEIVNSWGGETFIAGPYLIVPYMEIREFHDAEEGTLREKEIKRARIQLPETLSVMVDNTTEIRSRGILLGTRLFN